jgi:hypothetical protein
MSHNDARKALTQAEIDALRTSIAFAKMFGDTDTLSRLRQEVISYQDLGQAHDEIMAAFAA